MAKLLLSCLLHFILYAWSSLALAQPDYINYHSLPVEKHTLQKVFKVDASQEHLYDSIRGWLAIKMKDSHESIKLDDREAGILIGKLYSPRTLETDYEGVYLDLLFTFKIEVKDGRYRYTASDFYASLNMVTPYLVRVGKEYDSAMGHASIFAEDLFRATLSSVNDEDF